MVKITSIIFDLGGVILNIDYKRTDEAFIQLGITHFTEIFSRLNQSKFFDDFETGRINENDFFNAIRVHSKKTISDSQIETAWNAMLLHFPEERLNFLL